MFLKSILFLNLVFIILLCKNILANEIENISIAYIEIEDDVRYDPDIAYARIQLQPSGRPFTGALVAYEESNRISEIVGKKLEINKIRLSKIDDIYLKIEELAKEDVHFFIIDADKSFFANISNLKTNNVVIFNISVQDNVIRNELCDIRVFHTIPSYAMLSDSIAQYLVYKNWKKVLVLEGPNKADKEISKSFQDSISKYGLQVVDLKDFILSNDPRKREESNLTLLTAGKKYDVIYLADSQGEFGRYLPYSTKLPRPVIGSTGLTAETWHWSFERHGAPQLNSRFEKLEQSRRMTGYDWSAWAAVNIIFKSAMKSKSVNFEKIKNYFTNDNFGFDGFKGPRLSFRTWNNQLRQPILLSTHNALIKKTPIKGFLHKKNNLDTLGFDELESKCNFRL